MKVRILPVLLAFACTAASAGGTPVVKYTPEIHGMLTSGRHPVASNVCLRQSDSEIRSCGYADASGHFFIPSAPVRPSPLSGDKDGAKPLTFWLEAGNVLSPQKLARIEAAADRNAAIDLSCDMSERGRSDPTFRSCAARTAKPLVMYVQRDDTPYRMVHPASPAK